MLLKRLDVLAKNLKTFNSKDSYSLFFAGFHKLYGIIWPKQKNTALDESAFFEVFFNVSQLHNPPSYGI